MIPEQGGHIKQPPALLIISRRKGQVMTLLAIAFMGIVTALVMASEGDYSGLKIIGKILLYIVVGGFFLWFLAMTGWGGLILILVICFIVVACGSMKD